METPNPVSPSPLPPEFKPWGMEPRVFCTLMHLSFLANAIIPIPCGGFVLFFIMWLTNKEQSAFVDNHGKAILNWLISQIIYFAAAFILVFVCIGIPLLIAIGICSVVFMIIGAVKANGGTVWKYPLSIQFLKVDASVTA